MVGAPISDNAVVNDQLTGSIVLPEGSLAPLTATVYVTCPSRVSAGVKRSVREGAS